MKSIVGNRKTIKGWVMYDWANSVYNLVISSSIFPIFYDTVTRNTYGENESNQVMVEYFGFHLSASALFSFVLSASFLVVAFLSPILSGIADYSGNKKRFLQFFCYLGALACISLYFFDASNLSLSMFSVFLGSVGFWNSLVFYNAYLPEIAPPQLHDRISARGFSLGYFGSMILLIFCLVWMQVWHLDVRWCFVFVGVWWISFAQLTYRVLPNNVYRKKPDYKRLLSNGFRALSKVMKAFSVNIVLKKYLRAYFFFNTGVQTVMLMATIFASKEIDWPGDGRTGLIIAILLIQVLGAVGAFTLSRLSAQIGNIQTLIVGVCVWIGICGFAYVVHTPMEFYILAASVGLVMGGIQALARSTYAKLLPDTEDHASYFSFYDVTEKIGIVVGTFFFGLAEFLTGSLRYSVISVAVFFIVGLILLLFVPRGVASIQGKLMRSK